MEEEIMDKRSSKSISRRDFGKKSAFASFAVAAVHQTKAMPANVDTVRIGILGCGKRSSRNLTQMLAGNDNVKLIALADVFQDHLDWYRKTFENHKDASLRSKVDIQDDHCFVGWDAYKKILETDIDVLFETCTPYVRPKHVEAAVEAKKHLFVEKPIAVDPVGVRRFIKAVKKHKSLGLSLVAGTQSRHDKSYIETMAKIHDGAIGDVVAMRSYNCRGLPWCVERDPKWSDLEYRLRNWYNYCWCCGDSIVEQAIHTIDRCNWIKGGPPESVFASGGRAWKPRTEMYGDTWDNFSCDYEYPDGTPLAFFGRHWTGCAMAGGLDAIGTKGRSNGQDMAEWDGDATMQQHQDLVNSIRGSGPRFHEGVRVAESTLTAIMGRMSAYTGKRLTWEEAMNSDLSIIPEKLDFNLKYPVGPIPEPEVVPKKPLEYR